LIRAALIDRTDIVHCALAFTYLFPSQNAEIYYYYYYYFLLKKTILALHTLLQTKIVHVVNHVWLNLVARRQESIEVQNQIAMTYVSEENHKQRQCQTHSRVRLTSKEMADASNDTRRIDTI
jgi:hypothetical protein